MSGILLIEDDQGIREMLSEVLTDEGYAVVSTEDGAAALAYLQACLEQPQLILLDLMMPVMDGWEFLRYHQQEPILKVVPVVVLSAVSRLECVAPIGAAAYLSKPCDIALLLDVVKQHITGVPPQFAISIDASSAPELIPDCREMSAW